MAKRKSIYNDNNLAIAYYRFSSHAQNEASIDQQREAAHKYAAAKGFTIVKEYEDRAISGTTEDRPGFQLMLSEVGKMRPAALIMWKTDRLGRDRYTLAISKKTIRDAGCQIHLVAEAVPTDAPEAVLMEGLLESMAEFYSKQLRQNTIRGMRYNAENGLYNGCKMLGYTVDENKHYVIDPATGPVVQRIFADYASGKPLKTIVDELNEQGMRSSIGGQFTSNSLRRILHNRSYTGVYRYSDIVVPGAIPPLVSDELFEKVQARFDKNKRKGPQIVSGEEGKTTVPRYWLTGHLFCGNCGGSMQGLSGTSKTGAKYYYYACAEQRRHRCKKRPVKKELVEWLVVQTLELTLNDSECLASLAVDAAAYHERYYKDAAYIDGLVAEQKENQKALDNLVKAIEKGIFSESTQQRLAELEAQKKALTEAIETEKLKARMTEDEHSIKAYFQKFANANLKDPEIREVLLDYFIDKIYVYDDHLEITGWYSEDRRRVEWTEFKDGEIEFDVFALGVTIASKSELSYRGVRICSSLVHQKESPPRGVFLFGFRAAKRRSTLRRFQCSGWQSRPCANSPPLRGCEFYGAPAPRPRRAASKVGGQFKMKGAILCAVYEFQFLLRLLLCGKSAGTSGALHYGWPTVSGDEGRMAT